MNINSISAETLGQLDESVYRLVEINPNTERLTNIGPVGSTLSKVSFPQGSKYTYSLFENLEVVESETSELGGDFEIYRHSSDMWDINDNGSRSFWSRRPEGQFLIGTGTRHQESGVGEDRGRRLLGVLETLIYINESRNY